MLNFFLGLPKIEAEDTVLNQTELAGLRHRVEGPAFWQCGETRLLDDFFPDNFGDVFEGRKLAQILHKSHFRIVVHSHKSFFEILSAEVQKCCRLLRWQSFNLKMQ